MKLIFVILFIVVSPTIILSQKIQNGEYVGYERNSFGYSKDCLIVHDLSKDENKSGYYYKVKLTVNYEKMTIEKTPVYFINHLELLLDSLPGGCYFYNVEYGKNKNILIGFLLNCKGCEKSMGEYVPLYEYVVYDYSYTDSTNVLIMNQSSEKNILFKKQN